MKINITKETWINLAKYAFGGIVASLIALLIGLKNPTSAGIVAILTILPNKQETLKTSLERGLAFIVSVGLAFLCFLLGFNVWAYLLFLALYLTFCAIFSFYSSMSINAVLMAHFLSYQEMNWTLIGNETLLFVIGAALGIGLNLTLRPAHATFKKQKERMDEEIKHILIRISERIINLNLENFDGSCLKTLEDYIHEAKDTAIYNQKNSFKPNSEQQDYVQMRKKQYRVLTMMVGLAKKVDIVASTSSEVSNYIKEVGNTYNENNDVSSLLVKLSVLREKMKESELPIERSEFEARARLFYLLDELEEFLNIKRSYVLTKTGGIVD